MRKHRKWKKWAWGYLFIAPTIIGLLVLNIWPVFKTMILSMQESLGFNTYRFLGFDNYRRLFEDVEVWRGLKNTLVFSAISVPAGIFISLVLAWLMSKPIKGSSVYRVIFFTPMVAAPAAVTMVWSWIYNTEFGVLNYFLGFLGIPNISWLNNTRYTMLSIIIIAIWGSIGQQIIIMIVAIKNVPRNYYEAAELDGAGDWAKFFRIAVPLVSPSIFFLSVTGFIGALSQFDLIYMIYGTSSSAAVDSVKTIMYQYYRQAFVVQDKPYASAIATITLLIILALTLFQMKLQKKLVHYE